MTTEILYATNNARGMLPRGLIEWLNIEISPVNPGDQVDEFKSHFPLAKSPALLGNNGFELTEVLAILYYLVNLKKDAELEKTLYGSSLQERSQVLRFLSFVNHEITLSAVAFVTAAKTNAIKEIYDEKVSKCIANLALLERQLRQHEYLVNDHITIADLYAASICGTLFGFALGQDQVGKFALIERWLPKVLQHPSLQGRADPSKFLEKTLAPVN